jgi:hypothetical protein
MGMENMDKFIVKDLCNELELFCKNNIKHSVIRGESEYDSDIECPGLHGGICICGAGSANKHFDDLRRKIDSARHHFGID